MAEERSLTRDDERAKVAWSCAFFFCVFASWYVVRPLRDAMGIDGGRPDPSRLVLVTLAATLAVTPIVSLLVDRVPRRRVVVTAYRLLAGTMLGLFVALSGGDPWALGASALFVWASVANLVAISLAWALMADVFSREQGVRLFAMIGAGGTLGAMAGSAAAAMLSRFAHVAVTLVIAAALLEAAVRCASRIEGRAAVCPQATERPAELFSSLRRGASDPFFLGIALYVALFTFTSTALYLEQARIVRATIASTQARAELFARIDFAANALTLALQLFVVGRLLRSIGIGAALAVLPLVTLGCFGALAIAPGLAVLVACQVLRRAIDLALAKPAREVLFTVARSEDKYRTKTFLDTFVYRAGDALAAVGDERLLGPVYLLVMAGACCAWALVGAALGRARPK